MINSIIPDPAFSSGPSNAHITLGGTSATFGEAVAITATSGPVGTVTGGLRLVPLATVNLNVGSVAGQTTQFNVGPNTRIPGNTLTFKNAYDLDLTNNGKPIGPPTYTGAVSSTFSIQTPTVSLAKTTQAPVAATITTYVATAQQLEVYDSASNTFKTNGTIDRTKPTIVLTHGFLSDPSVWSSSRLANDLHSKYPTENIVAWDWGTDAHSQTAAFLPNLPLATSRTVNEGAGLGQALVATLGANYTNSVHFVGHSLGTLVNSEAINVLHAHEPNLKIQDTLFDEASIANQFVSGSKSFTYVIGALPATGSTVSVDNYISAFGNLYPTATNIVLNYDPNNQYGKSGLLYWNSFHGYPISWYDRTVRAPSLSQLGYAAAIENGGSGSQSGDAYLQSTLPNGEFDLS